MVLTLFSEICSFAGGIVSLIGALVTARAVFVSEEQAISIGLPRLVADDREGQLQNPNVQNLLKGSRAAKRGLLWIAGGIFLQTIPSGIALFEKVFVPTM
jgi:hypothetical protein